MLSSSRVYVGLQKAVQEQYSFPPGNEPFFKLFKASRAAFKAGKACAYLGFARVAQQK
jgi:hypothetical protein